MELRQLEYFYTVGKLNSFTKASEELCISQPSITISIKKLEDELGVELIQRSKKGISLTEYGEKFHIRIKEIFKDLNNAVLEIEDLKNSKREVINIGIIPMAGEEIYKKIFLHYRNNENVEINVRSAGSREIVKG